MSERLVLGSRRSQLALWQSNWVRERLLELHPGLEIAVEEIATTGDKTLDVPLAKIGDKGLFVKELETALLEGRIDLAVHSAKDMPTALPDGLTIGAFTEREDVRDAFVGRVIGLTPEARAGRGAGVTRLADLRRGAVVGSSSLRRRSQMLAARPDLELVDLRGNVETRLRKIDEQDLDGTVLALAGLKRLERDDAVSFVFGFEEMLPAVGQGALAIEIRGGDERVAPLVAALDHASTAVAVRAERALMARLEGGCQVPVAAYGLCADCGEDGERLALTAFVGSIDGRDSVRESAEGAPAAPEALGESLAGRLIAAGADRILAEVRRASA